MTLVELLVAGVVLTMIVGAMVALAKTVQVGADYAHGRGEIAQHGRVVIDRIERAVRTAHATPTEPGVAVVTRIVGAHALPDTLVVWRGDANVDAVPQASEIVVYAPNYSQPQELLELTFPGDATTVSFSNATTLKATIDGLRSTGTQAVLTTLLHTVEPSLNSGLCGCVWFVAELHPTAGEMQNYNYGMTTWESLPWPQGWNSSTTAMRQAWVRLEVQLKPDENAATVGEQRGDHAAFFGSATLAIGVKK